MLEALIAGQRNPRLLAQMARGTMRAKTATLEEALTGHFDDHHGFLLQVMLEHIDALTTQIDTLSARIEEVIAPFSHHITRFDEITGVGTTAAQELIAEIGVDATRFPALRTWCRGRSSHRSTTTRPATSAAAAPVEVIRG